MKHLAEHDGEVTRLVLSALAGDASIEELDRLGQLVLDDRTLACPVVETIEQDAWLTWYGEPERHGAPAWAPAADGAEIAPEEPPGAESGSQASNPLSPRLAFAAVFLLSIGVVFGVVASQSLAPRDARRHAAMPPRASGLAPAPGRAGALEEGGPACVGHVVRASACRWSPAADSALLVGASLRRGESLNLVSGVAEVRLDRFSGVADLRIEGPAGLSLTDDGGCRLIHGRVTAEVSPRNAHFTLDTPNGAISFSTISSVGVSADGSVVEVHVFEGTVTLMVPWEVVQSGSNVIELLPGESVTLQRQSERNLAVRRGVSQPKAFRLLSSMQSDQLRISEKYVDDVLSLDPVLYWRFEEGTDARIKNLAGEGFNGHVEGKISLLRDGNNQFLDFRSGVSQDEVNALLISDQALPTSLEDGYSFEVWFKPSHFHHGTIAALAPETQEPDSPRTHGMILNLGGQWTNQPRNEQPGRIRFFHRWHPVDFMAQGVSCYSADMYDVRRWQHLVAVKDRREMRLYLDGNLTARLQDDAMQTSDLALLVGQSDPGSHESPFIGQLDELVFYAKPLTREDVQRHFELVRPRPPAVDSWTSQPTM